MIKRKEGGWYTDIPSFSFAFLSLCCKFTPPELSIEKVWYLRSLSERRVKGRYSFNFRYLRNGGRVGFVCWWYGWFGMSVGVRVLVMGFRIVREGKK